VAHTAGQPAIALGLTAQETVLLRALIELGESSAEMLAQRMGLPDGPILSAALDRLLSLKYAIKRDDTTGAIYRAVAQALG
jgi:hypothetical protein